LTRRREAYHQLALEGGRGEGPPVPPGDGTPSIHEIEKGVRLDRLPPVDGDTRAMFVDRVLPGALTLDAYASGAYDPLASWAARPLAFAVHASEEAIDIVCTEDGFEKRLRFDAGGRLTVAYRWDPAAFPARALFAPEISLAHPLEVACRPEADVWTFAIATMAKSERGLEETVQGRSLTPRWPVQLGEGRIEVGP
jgi:hypothetical protein